MTTANQHPRANTPSSFDGFSLQSSVSIIIAGAVTGVLVSLALKAVGYGFLLPYSLAAVGATLMVRPRGIFITCAVVPAVFGVGIFGAGLVVAERMSAGDPFGISVSELLSAVIPITTNFPWLLALTLLVVTIGIGRVYLLKRRAELDARRSRTARRRATAATSRTQTLSRAARSRNEQASVEEILQRARQRSAQAHQAADYARGRSSDSSRRSHSRRRSQR
ncbi:DUF6542 domain-containing protein [Corynebacterium uterequi]|uniref:DUF6542 domain-containing protein n=1 Tax=Corynebacterium uterequi TaxID=1072256 RepID=A0A0G3HFS0_9CORY|nr:DUF6542 domain-containing protein [Corynebacterium uterequi]AKK10798.1 hypothetical protein CUTER_03960 [Corynebacterium uterequi]